MKIFKQISIDIAKKYNTTPQVIAYIRSCNKNLNLNRTQIIDRQWTKIPLLQKDISNAPRAMERRNKLSLKYPKDKERHEYANANTLKEVEYKKLAIKKRGSFINFLTSINDNDFKEITKHE